MNIKDVEKQFKDTELASIQVISKLQKEVEKLKIENAHLLLLIEGSVPLIQNNTINIGISNERIICETQLLILKNKAINNTELTLEETRKFQVFVDVLDKLKEKKDDGIHADIPESELLRVVKNE